jgi:lipoate-protein ligase A
MFNTLPICCLIVDPCPRDGAFNMAMDAALLSLAVHSSHSVVRIYRWQSPTVSLGYFQANAAPVANPFPQLPAVRRLSGGGAILHDREWTYSCVLPPSHPARHDPSSLYATVHSALILLLHQCNAPCQLRSNAIAQSSTPALPQPTPSQTAPEHFLCFLRGNPNDIVHIKGPKVVGSAQRRRLGAILQHGSILLQASTLTPELPGLLDLSPNFLDNQFAKQLPNTVAATVATHWQQRDYSPTELQLAAEIQQEQNSTSNP